MANCISRRVSYYLYESVFVKQKGYCEWPAQIMEIDQKRKFPFRVKFFGWHDQWCVFGHLNCIYCTFSIVYFHLIAYGMGVRTNDLQNWFAFAPQQ